MAEEVRGDKENHLSLSKAVEAMEFAATMASNAPQLVILLQGNLTSEHFSKNGIAKQVHVVVKNLVFVIEVGSNVDLNKCNLEAKLLYDFDREDDIKEVSYVKNEPLEYKVNILDGGTKATIETRIKVLTSQHEDMLFRVRLVAIDPMTGTSFGAITQPIKVISKMTQVGKSTKTKDVNSPAGKKRQSSSGVPVTTVNSDAIANALQELTRQLQEQQRYIHFIAHKLLVESSQVPGRHDPRETDTLQALSSITMAPPTLTPVVMGENGTQEYPVVQGEVQMQEQKAPELEDAFRTFLSAYHSLSPEDKQQKLLGFMQSAQGEDLGEIFDALGTATLPLRKKQKIVFTMIKDPKRHTVKSITI